MTVSPSNRNLTPSPSIAPSKIEVCPASLSDLENLSDVLALTFHPRVGLQALVWPVVRLGIREDIKHRLQGNSRNYCCLGAWVGDRLVGTLEIGMRRTSGHPELFDRQSQRAPYIANLAVLPHWRRKGVASRLLVGAEGVAASWGGGRIYLHVMETNKAARRLYAGAGYLTQGHRDTPWVYFGAPRQLLLYKTLAPSTSLQ